MAVEVAAEPPNRAAKPAASATCPAAHRRCYSLGFKGDEQLVASYGLPTLKAALKVREGEGQRAKVAAVTVACRRCRLAAAAAPALFLSPYALALIVFQA